MDRRNVLFSLKPKNTAANEIVNLDSNRHLVSLREGEEALYLGRHRSETAYDDTHCIATIGRNGDIVLPLGWPATSRIHCAFVIGAAACCITFVDKSSNASCQVYGGEGDTQELLTSSNRQIDSSSGLRKIKIRVDGFDETKTAEFDIIWRFSASGLPSALRAWRKATLPRHPKLADTQLGPLRDAGTETQHAVFLATGDQTRVGDLTRFVLEKESVGRGAFGTVFKACDPKSKDVVAVKVQRPHNQRQWKDLHRERDILGKLCHANIVQYLGYRVDEPRTVAHIFMSLQNGSLEDLVEKRRGLEVDMDDKALARSAYHDILKGLDYLHSQGFIHRDLKPGNVLYTLKHNCPSFCLADFGLTNHQRFAQTYCGTPEFLAPEVFYHRKQTTAVDMWSLLITMIWTLDLADYRSQTWHSYSSLLKWVIPTISAHWASLKSLHGLAVIDSGKRATAAQMLVENYGGEGLTTDLRHIPKWLPAKPPHPGDLHIYNSAVQWSAPKHDLTRINRGRLGAGSPRGPEIRRSPLGGNVAPMAKVLHEPTRSAFPHKVQRKKDLIITGAHGRGGEKRAVHEGTSFFRHPAARVAPEIAAAKQPAATEANLVGRRPADDQKRKAHKKIPTGALKADRWFTEIFKMPGAFPA